MHCRKRFRLISGKVCKVLTSGVYSPPTYHLPQEISAYSKGLNSDRPLMNVLVVFRQA